MHAVQVLPALALLLLASDTVERHRVRVVALGTVGYACMITATMVQTYGGRSPLDVGVVPVVLALSGFALLVASALIALRGLGSRVRPPTGQVVGT